MFFDLTDLLTYGTVLGFVFVSIRAMTRGGRGWPLTIACFAVIGGVNVGMEWLYHQNVMPLEDWVAVCFSASWNLVVASVIVLSRDSLGRRTFLALYYAALAVCFAAAFHWIAFSGDIGLSEGRATAVGLVFVVGVNLAFLRWILPSVPRDDTGFGWGVPCLAAAILCALLFTGGVWPISLLTASVAEIVPFALSSVASWVLLPLVCRLIRAHQRNVAVEHGLELLTAEIKVRRSALDEARRLRHDYRHHCAQIAEYMLFGQHDKVLAHLRQMDEEVERLSTDKLVWCRNETVNAILSRALRNASAKGVAFSAEVFDDCPVALPDVEMVALFANLIENAVNACGRTKGGASAPRVAVTIRQRENGLGISVSNPVPDGFALSADGFPCEELGIGLESVRRVVDRYRGEWGYSLADGILTCRVGLLVHS